MLFNIYTSSDGARCRYHFRELIDRGLVCVLTGLDIARIDAALQPVAPVIINPPRSKNLSRREEIALVKFSPLASAIR